MAIKGNAIKNQVNEGLRVTLPYRGNFKMKKLQIFWQLTKLSQSS